MIQEVTMEVIQEIYWYLALSTFSKLQYQYIVGVTFRLCIRPGYRIDVSVLPQNQCFSYLKSGQGTGINVEELRYTRSYRHGLHGNVK